MKFCLSVLLLALVIFQAVPLKKIGKMLDKTQTSEEVQSQDDDGDDAFANAGLFNGDLILSHASFDVVTHSLNAAPDGPRTVAVSTMLCSADIERIPAPPPEC